MQDKEWLSILISLSTLKEKIEKHYFSIPQRDKGISMDTILGTCFFGSQLRWFKLWALMQASAFLQVSGFVTQLGKKQLNVIFPN